MNTKIGEVRLDAGKVARGLSVTVRIEGWYRFRLRLWAGILLIRLAGAISGLSISVDTVDARQTGQTEEQA